MKQVSSEEALKLLKKNGWNLARQSGSHVTFTKPGARSIITIPHPRKSLSPGIVKMIERVASFKF